MPHHNLKLRLFNTLTGREEPFEPIEPGHVRMYNCGPTVYNNAHLGNMSAYVFADVLRRALEYAGLRVTQVVNVTDVGHMTDDSATADGSGEDKLEKAAAAQRRTPWDLARTYLTRYLADLEALNIRAAHYYPRATEFIPEMISMIERLVAKGLAYVTPGGDVYFDVASFKDYGRLSKNTLESLVAGKRVDVRAEKRHPADFALWKRDPSHIMQWDSPFGRGFPGWHIECSAMAMRFLGETIDIHTGGEDHIFPHHECEIAQSEGATGKPFARFWMHKRFIMVDGGKMAKSAGNFVTVRDLGAQGYSGREVRYALLATHYRMQSSFTLEVLDGARKSLERIDNFVAKLEREGGRAGGPGPEVGEATLCADTDFLAAAEHRFDRELAADLNLSGALAAIFDLIREGNKRALSAVESSAVLRWLTDIDDVLGVIFFRPAIEAAAPAPRVGEGPPPVELEELLAKRQAARAARDWTEADRVRDLIAARGYAIEDRAEGPRLRKA